MSYKLNPFTNNFDYYDAGTGSTVSQDLNSVLTTGNNAGSNDIDMNNKDLLNVDNIDLNTINGAAYPPSISGTTAGGDLSGIYPNPKVDGLQGYAVSNIAPISGQTLQWSGSEWTPKSVPTGGSGGGGVFYYFNYQNIASISPTTGLPTSPVAPSQLGINYSIGSGSITSANLSQGSYSLVCGFVTIAGTPSVTNIPAGLWDFNIWADILGGTGNANQTQFQIRVYKYDGSTAPSLLASSDDIYIYDPVATVQYIGNVTMPQTTILSTDRIYIELWAKKNVNQSRQIRFYFDSLHPSHVHTTLPSVAGTGIAKVVNGVFQSPASTIVNADVSASAAIAISKLAPLPVEIQVACSDETTAITAGTNKVTFRMPHAMTVTSVRASLTTAQASGSIFTIDINEGGVSILSTKLTIDNTEKTSTTAATAPVISDTALADDAEITVDVDQIGNGTATGLKVTIIGTRV
jgi:hypothetical protein